MIVNMPNKEGVTLATQGKYCADNIEVVPTFETENTLNEYLIGTRRDITAEDLAGTRAIRDGCFAYSPIYSVIIPDNIAHINAVAFAYSKSLISVTIGKGVVSFGNEVFRGCTSLKSINIPDTVTKISSGMFNGCTSLESIDIPDTVTTISDYAFTNCKNLASITLPDHSIHFVTNAFSGGTNSDVDRNVYITNLDTWCRHSFDNGHSHPFAGTRGHLYLNNEKVTELVIPDTITFLGNAAFFNCVDLTSVIIHDGVTACNAWTFNGCTNLKTVSIGSGMQRLNDAFSGCTSLMEVTCFAETPPVLSSNGLKDVPVDCIIKVPAASVEAYKSATNWIARADYIVAIEE